MKPAPRRGTRIVAVLVVVLVTSCATVKREVVIGVNTSGVRVYEGDRLLSNGGTPRLRLEVDRDHELRLEADGHASERLLLRSSVSGVRVLLSAVQTLVLPIVVLPALWPAWIAQGYWYVLEPEEPRVHLRRLAEAPAASSARPHPSPAPAPTPAAPPRPQVGFCGSCGARAALDARFCGGCGAAMPRRRG